MIGWVLVLGTVAVYELWAEINHHDTLTYAVRRLPWGVRGAILLIGFALLIHLVIPTTWQDPIDRLEHELTHERTP